MSKYCRSDKRFGFSDKMMATSRLLRGPARCATATLLDSHMADFLSVEAPPPFLLQLGCWIPLWQDLYSSKLLHSLCHNTSQLLILYVVHVTLSARRVHSFRRRVRLEALYFDRYTDMVASVPPWPGIQTMLFQVRACWSSPAPEYPTSVSSCTPVLEV